MCAIPVWEIIFAFQYDINWQPEIYAIFLINKILPYKVKTKVIHMDRVLFLCFGLFCQEVLHDIVAKVKLLKILNSSWVESHLYHFLTV